MLDKSAPYQLDLRPEAECPGTKCTVEQWCRPPIIPNRIRFRLIGQKGLYIIAAADVFPHLLPASIPFRSSPYPPIMGEQD